MTNQENSISNNLIYDACIVGSGMSGQIIASTLAKNNKKVIIVESGKYTYDKITQNLNNFISTGLSLRNETNENYKNNIIRQFGGSANNWANQIMFYRNIDLENRKWVGQNLKWQISFDELESYYKKIIDMLYKDSLSDTIKNDKIIDKRYVSILDKEFLSNDDFNFTSSYHPEGIEKFNYKSKFSKKLINNNNIKILTEANITNFIFNESKNNVNQIEFKIKNLTKKIRSKVFVLCAGATENAKILLNNSLHHNVLKNKSLGRFFMDHPRINIGQFKLNKKVNLSNLLGIKGKKLNFRKGLRFNEQVQENNKILNSHIFISPIFQDDDIKIFDKTLQKIKHLIQLKKVPLADVKKFKLKQFIEQLYFAPHKISNGYLNYLMNRYYILSNNKFSFNKLSVDYHGEQAPNFCSNVNLNKDKDINGQFNLNINWELNQLDYKTIEFYSEKFSKICNEFFTFRKNNNFLIFDQKHRIGTTRMGINKEDGVVDLNCKVYGVNNLYVGGSSVFRTGSSTNPGITIMAMSLRLAEYLNKL